MACQECKSKLHPENPSMPFYIRGRYLKPSCYYCPDYETESQPVPGIIEHIHRHSDMSRKDFAKLQSLIGEVKYLREKLQERSNKKGKYTIRS